MKFEQSEESDFVVRLRQPRWYWSLALLMTAFYVVTSLIISAHRQLWFDEILTALVCRLPNVRTIWKALCEIEEQTPPLYFVIARISDSLFNHTDFGLRVPSAVALGVGMMVTFDIARRLTDGLYGMIAMSFLASPFVAYYGYEARSYGLFLMLAAVVLWLWLFTPTKSKAAAVAFGTVFLLGMAIHYYLLLCLLPFAIKALAERRLFHPKVIAAAGGVIVSLAVLYPQIARGREFTNSVGPIWSPSMARLLDAYTQFMPNAILPAIVIAVTLIIYGRSDKPSLQHMSEGERLGWLFLLVPLAGYLVGQFVTHLFHDRYIISAAPGVVVGATCLMWRYCGGSRYLSLALLVTSCGSSVARQLITLKDIDHIRADSGDYQERTRQTLALDDTFVREGKQHVVLSWDIRYLETWYYSSHRVEYECITSEKRWTIKKYAPLKFVSVEDIVADASKIALIDPTPDLVKALKRAGLHLRVRFAGPQYVVYLE